MPTHLSPNASPEDHAELLRRYNPDNKPWWQIPDDGYLYDHLAEHLYEAALFDELRGLFDTPEWMKTRLTHDNYEYDGYIADLMQIWRYADQQLHTPTNVALEELVACCRYALIRASLNSWADDQIPALVARALELGLWSEKRVINFARYVSDCYEKSRYISAILSIPKLSSTAHSTLINMGLANLSTHRHGYYNDLLSPLLPHLKNDGDIERAFEISATATPLQERRTALQAIAKKSVNNQTRMARLWQIYAATIEEMIPTMMPTGEHSAYLQSQIPTMRNELMKGIAPYLRGELLKTTHDQLAASDPDSTLVKHLSAMLKQPDAFQFEEVSEPDYAQPAEKPDITLEAALQIELDQSRASALSSLAPFLPDEDLHIALDNALAMNGRLDRNNVLAALAPRMTRGMVQRAIDTLPTISDAEYQCYMLAAFAPHLSYEQLARGVEIAIGGNYQYEMYMSEALIRLLPHLPDTLWQRVFDFVFSKEWNSNYIGNLVSTLATRMTSAQVEETLDKILLYKDEYSLARAVQAIAPQLTIALLNKALDGVRQIERVHVRVEALATLSTHVKNNNRDAIFQEALGAIVPEDDSLFPLRALEAIAPHLTGELYATGFQLVQRFSYYQRFEAMKALAPFVPPVLVNDLLKFVAELEHDVQKAKLIELMGPNLTGGHVQKAFETIPHVSPDIEQSTFARGRAIAALTPRFEGALLSNGIEIILEIENEGWRSIALRGLLPKLDQQGLHKALAVAKTTNDAHYRSEILVALLPYLDIVLQKQVSQLWLDIEPASMGEIWWYQDRLLSLIPYLTDELVTAVLNKITTLESAQYRAKSLAALLPHIDETEPVIYLIRQNISQFLLEQASNPRRDVLDFLADDQLFCPPIFEAETLREIADQTIAICNGWDW